MRARGLLLIAIVLGMLGEAPLRAQFSSDGSYDVGSPTVTDLYVSPFGNDGNSGDARIRPLQTLSAAWARIPTSTPASPLQNTGYRINLMPGNLPCEGDCVNFFTGRAGTHLFPIILRAADGPGTATILGGLDLSDVHYLYLEDLTLRAGAGAPMATHNVFHMDASDHILLRGLTIDGGDPIRYPDDIQEDVKINRSRYIYLEGNEIEGTFQNCVDFFSVQYGHLLRNKLHRSTGWGTYLKGGSAYVRVEGNEYFDCRLGFQAGESSNFETMVSPFLHYEAYDVQFVNNILHDITGVGMSVSGGYNVLMAHNTLYRVGTSTNPDQGYPLFQCVHGGRSCYPASEVGTNNAAQVCGDDLNQGGWGLVGDVTLLDRNGGDWIPNRNVYVYDNVFYNPAPAATLYSQILVQGPVTPPAAARNIPSPSLADQNLQIRGNVIWNGSPGLPLGIEDPDQGCRDSNPTCSAAHLRADNTIDAVEPQVAAPASGDFHPAAGSDLFTIAAVPIPPFPGGDRPASPPTPEGDLTNAIPFDRDGSTRAVPDPPGAYSRTSAVVVPGDVNGDGVIDAADLNLLLELFLNLRAPTPEEMIAGDTRPKPGAGGRPYGDGRIQADDLNWAFRRFLRLETAP